LRRVELYKKGRQITQKCLLEILPEMKDPKRSMKVIMVAGSIGKGSITLLLGKTLTTLGFRVGTFTSPWIKDPRESIQINNTPIEPELYSQYIDEIEEKTPAMVYKTLSSFEKRTLLSYYAFAREGIEWAIMEIGIGGRFDAVNLVSPNLSIISPIVREHESILGEYPNRLCWHKTGIIYPRVPVITYQKDPRVTRLILLSAKENNAPLVIANVQPYEIIASKPIPTFQQENLTLVIETIRYLANKYPQQMAVPFHEINWSNIFFQTKLLGRCERIKKPWKALIDGSHTEQSLLQLLKLIPYNRDLVFIVSITRQKSIITLLHMLHDKIVQLHKEQQIEVQVIFTEYQTENDNNAQAISADKLMELWQERSSGIYHVKCIHNSVDAFSYVDDQIHQNPHAFVVLTGSMYLVVDFYQYWNQRK
jgi:dihydrofolate synthase / folylpolyglutamate synthase